MPMPQKSSDTGEYEDMYFMCFSSMMSVKRGEGITEGITKGITEGITKGITKGIEGRYSFSKRGLS
jgi:Rod binding domain-containing protein